MSPCRVFSTSMEMFIDIGMRKARSKNTVRLTTAANITAMVTVLRDAPVVFGPKIKDIVATPVLMEHSVVHKRRCENKKEQHQEQEQLDAVDPAFYCASFVAYTSRIHGDLGLHSGVNDQSHHFVRVLENCAPHQHILF